MTRFNIFTVGIACFVLVGVLAVPVSAAVSGESVTEPGVHIDVAADGDASVSVVQVYDLSDSDDRDAFQSLEDDSDAQDELRDRFVDRMVSVAEDTGGDGAVISKGEIRVESSDDMGVVTLSVNWASLAVVNDGDVTVTEPLVSGFASDHPVTLTGPENAEIVSVTPEPDSVSDTQAVWDAGTDFTGFEAVFSLSDAGGSDSSTADSDSTDDSTPGFGVIAGVLAVISAVLVAVLSVRSLSRSE